MAGIILIEMKKGDYKRLNPVTIHRTDGSPIDLTDCEVKWLLYRENAFNPLLSKGSKDDNNHLGVQVTNAIGGEVCISINREDTISLEQGRYYHEIQVVTPGGRVSTVASGTIVLLNKL